MMTSSAVSGRGGNSYSDLLQHDLERMSSIQEIIQSSGHLTSGMNSVLSAFEERLADLEKTILPVYQETSNLQRRKHNIEKTLDQFDSVISYYSVSRELDSVIRAGLATTDTHVYLMAMTRLQDALSFFTSHNPHSVELQNISHLITLGLDMLNKEFHSLVSRHSKPTPPAIVLVMINPDQTDDDQPLDREEEFDIPGSVWENVLQIGHWLSDQTVSVSSSVPLATPSVPVPGTSGSGSSTTTTGTKSTEFVSGYVTVRSSIVVRTLQELQKCQRSNSGRSGDQYLSASSQMSRSPAAALGGVVGSVANRRSLNFTARLERKANRLWNRAQQQLAHATGVSIGSSGPVRSDFSEDYLDETDVEVCATSVSAVLRLLSRELNYLSALCRNLSQQRLPVLLQSLAEQSIAMLVKNIETLTQKGRRCITHQLFSPVLCLFPLLSHLMTVRSEYERLFSGCETSVRNRISGFIDMLHQTCVKCLDGFIEWTESDTERYLPPDGTVHQRTSYVLNFCHQLMEHVGTVGWVLCQHSKYSAVTSSAQIDKNGVVLGQFTLRAVEALVRSLTSAAQQYSDLSLRAIFLLNNNNYIQQSCEQLQLLPLMLAADAKADSRLQEAISEQRRAYTQCWSRVLQLLVFSEEIPTLRLEIDKLSDSERKLLKEKFSMFCREMEDMSRLQRTFSVPDIELRESLKRGNKECILPKYSRFYDRYSGVSFSKNRERYIRFTPAQISVMVDGFFDTTA